MKNIKQFLSISVILMTILCSCKSGGDKFLGTWKNEYNKKLIITKAGNTAYAVKSITPREVLGFSGNTETTTVTYQDGNLVVMGMVYLSYSNGKIIENGVEYEKTE